MTARELRDMKVCEQLHVWGEILTGAETEMQHAGWVQFDKGDGDRFSLWLCKGAPMRGLISCGVRPHAVIYCEPCPNPLPLLQNADENRNSQKF